MSLPKLLEMKAEALQYVFCALWGLGGGFLAVLTNYLPTPEEAVSAFLVGVISASGGLILRFVWVRLKRWALNWIKR